MNFNKKMLKAVVAFCLVSVAAYSEPRIEQKLVMTASHSMEEVKQMASQFCEEVKNDANIQVKSVKYSKNGNEFNATIVCLVSEVDSDFMRVEEKLTGRQFSPETAQR